MCLLDAPGLQLATQSRTFRPRRSSSLWIAIDDTHLRACGRLNTPTCLPECELLPQAGIRSVPD